MDILPIFKALGRLKIIIWLLMLEIALSCAIVCNGVFLIVQRVQYMHMPSGVAEHEVVQIQQAPIAPPLDRYARAQEDLAALRQIPGVRAAGMTNQLPFSGYSSNGNVMLSPTQPHRTLSAATYFGENLIQTLGLRLLSGRDFESGDYVDADIVLKSLANGSGQGFPMPAIISQTMAKQLWPRESPLGKLIWLAPKASFRVVGVVATLARANAYNTAIAQYSMIVPLHMGADKDQSYVLRVRPQDRQTVLVAASTALRRIDPARVITHVRTYDDIRGNYFKGDHAMTAMLVGVIIAVLLVTGLGIVGLASFWVAQRRKQIGVRRALGATRADILRYFQTENFLIVTFGIVIGMVLAYGVNLLLMLHYELPRLPSMYLPAGAVVLWLIGQLAVLAPALRAAAVPPAVATRSV
jgi:putative ABC transport system permease protein